MTETVDLSKARVGDHITIGATVIDVAAEGPQVEIKAFYGMEKFWVNNKDVLSILPRPLAKGDYVTDPLYPGLTLKIRGIDGDDAWLHGGTLYAVRPLSSLTRAPDPSGELI